MPPPPRYTPTVKNLSHLKKEKLTQNTGLVDIFGENNHQLRVNSSFFFKSRNL